MLNINNFNPLSDSLDKTIILESNEKIVKVDTNTEEITELYNTENSRYALIPYDTFYKLYKFHHDNYFKVKP